MAQRRHHYERAFEAYLRQRRMPYVAVDEARRALLPEGANLQAALRLSDAADTNANALAVTDEGSETGRGHGVLKSFDFVIYAGGRAEGTARGAGACAAPSSGGASGSGGAVNLLVDVKGRKITRRTLARRTPAGALMAPPPRTRLENWATLDDIASLRTWEGLFGPGFASALVFVYWCEEQPPDALFHEVFDFEGRWYAMRSVLIGHYAALMRTRSPRWRTVDLRAADFDRISQPLGPAWLGSVGA
ncbi:MAG: HYExAFE family protein [Phycisphaerales bacterium]|jgi:hypothetical protein|nr:HYExAFE family protein [Phycisphaerales bacterium]